VVPPYFSIKKDALHCDVYGHLPAGSTGLIQFILRLVLKTPQPSLREGMVDPLYTGGEKAFLPASYRLAIPVVMVTVQR